LSETASASDGRFGTYGVSGAAVADPIPAARVTTPAAAPVTTRTPILLRVDMGGLVVALMFFSFSVVTPAFGVLTD
jgi:hypothetical protein